MSIQEEIVDAAKQLHQEIRDGRTDIFGMDNRLPVLAKNGEDDVLAKSFIIGLAACRRWFWQTRGEFSVVKNSREFKARGSEAHQKACERFDELKEENLDRMENLLILGYMHLTGEKDFWVNRIRPISLPLAECLEKTYDGLEGQTHEEGIYKLLHKRVTNFRKKHPVEEEAVGFLRKIHSSIHC